MNVSKNSLQTIEIDPKTVELESLQKTVSEMELKYSNAVSEKEKVEADKRAAEQEFIVKSKELENMKEECKKLKSSIEKNRVELAEGEKKTQALQSESEKLSVQAKSKLPQTVFKSKIMSLEDQLAVKDGEVASL